MKRMLSIVTIAAVMAASCNTSPKTAGESTTATPAPVVNTDTVGLAAYQAWKAQNELADYNQFKSGSAAAASTPAVYRSTPAHRSSSGSRSRSYGSMSSSSSNTAQAPRKKGWSKAAKGAVIGGVGGAVGGAVINKRNRVAGGVIGGVIGAGVGYGIGRGMDKRDGRY